MVQIPSYKRPGIYVEETTNPTQAIPGADLAAGAFIASNTRGPVTPTLVTSWQQYTNLFGGFGTATQFLPHAVFQFFNNGGRSAWVTRVVATGNAAATKMLQDRAGTPLNTLSVTAKNPGAWGNSVYVTITDAAPDRFNMLVYYNGTADANVVERWIDLSLNTTDARYAPGILNSVTAGSNYISVVDQFSTTASPNNRPALQTATALTGGADGSAPGSSDITTSINLLDQVDAPLVLNLPGTTDTPTLTNAINYAANRGDVFVVCEPPENTTVSTVTTTFATGLPVSSFGAVYFPWVYVTDPAVGSPGATRKIPPGGCVVGQFSNTDVLRGPFKAPAGLDARLPGAVGIETKLIPSDLDTLNTTNINAIRQIPGAGVCLMGARTLKTNASDRYISVRRSLIYIRSSLISGTRWALFEPNDSVLWAALRASVERFLIAFWQQGGLRGATPAEAFYIKCDSDINTPAAIAAGTVNLEIGVAVQYPAEFVVIRIGIRDNGATATTG